MFKNAVKKFAAVGLVFSLCVPCCFTSAQPGKNNGTVDSNNSLPYTVKELFDLLVQQGIKVAMDNNKIMNSAEELKTCILCDEKPFRLVAGILGILDVEDEDGALCAISICLDAGLVLKISPFS